MEQLEAAVCLMPILHELNDGKIIKVHEKYPVLKTKKRKVENWWDSLNWSQKVDVGCVAIHYCLMTPNNRFFSCREEDKYKHLTKKQKGVVDGVFSRRKDN